jgi:hypothetical protein
LGNSKKESKKWTPVPDQQDGVSTTAIVQIHWRP